MHYRPQALSHVAANGPGIHGDAFGRLLALSYCTLLAAMPLLLNGHPIFFSDSGTYLHAFSDADALKHPPLDRPIFYSIYLYVFRALFNTNTAAVIVQCMTVAFLTYRFLLAISAEGKLSKILAAFCALLPFSYLAVMAGALMPDVWLPCAFLSTCLMLLERGPKQIIYFIIVTCAISFAPANGMILASTLAGCLIITSLLRLRIGKAWRKALPIAGAVLIGMLLPASNNYYAYGKFTPIVSSSAFLYATLARGELTDGALQKACMTESRSNRICENLNLYTKLEGNYFLWNEKWNEPVWNIDNQDLLKKANRIALFNHPFRVILKIIKDAAATMALLPENLDQLYSVKYDKTKWAATQLNAYGDMQSFQASKQQTQTNVFAYLKIYRLLLLLLALAALVLAFRKKLYGHTGFVVFLLFCLCFILANAIITGGLSMPDYRYNARALDVAVLMVFCYALGLPSQPARAKEA